MTRVLLIVLLLLISVLAAAAATAAASGDDRKQRPAPPPPIPSGGGKCSVDSDCNYNNGSCVNGKCQCGNAIIVGEYCECRPNTSGVCTTYPNNYLVHGVCVSDQRCVEVARAERNKNWLRGCDLVSDWNEEALQAVIAGTGMSPPAVTRILAILHIAIHDSVQHATCGRYHKYKYHYDDEDEPVNFDTFSREAAAAQAGHDVCAYFWPDRKSFFDARLSSHLSLIHDGNEKDDGILVGSYIAAAAIADRKDDGAADTPADYIEKPGNGYYKYTPPTYNHKLAAREFPKVRPFVMDSPSHFRVTPDSDRYSDYVKSQCPFDQKEFLKSQVYTDSYNEVWAYGGVEPRSRSEDETNSAYFWRVDPGPDIHNFTPPGLHNTQAQQFCKAFSKDIEESARTFALLNIGLVDASIMCWDMKQVFDFWRPVTGITYGDRDNNDKTSRDGEWLSMLITPNHQSTPSGHSTYSGLTASVLEEIFDDKTPWMQEANEFPGMWRSWKSLWEAAEEDAYSRVYGGVHWRFDCVLGLETGRVLGKHIVQNALLPK